MHTALSPLVTIYIPTHNRADMVSRAIKSALAQTYTKIEVIVVNDGSADDTETVLKEFASADNRFRFISNPVAYGACASRNIAIQAAKGEYVTGLDDDDEFTPDRVQIFVDNISPQYSFLTAGIIEDNGEKRISLTLDSGLISLKKILTFNSVGNQVFCLKSKIIEAGGFDENFPAFQDYDLWTRLLEQFGPCFKLKQATYIMYTGHEKQRITSSAEKRITALNMFINKHEKHFTKSNYNSFVLLKKDILNEKLTTLEYLKLLHFDNIKPATGLYLDTHFKALKSIVNIFR